MEGISTNPQNPISYSRTWPAGNLSTISFAGCLVLLLFINIQCKKSTPPPNILPAMTQEGKNTFGCKINGDVWIPYYQCGLITIFSKCEELHTVVNYADTTSKLPFYVELTVARKIGQGSFTSLIMGATILKTGKIDSFFTVTYVRDSVSYYPQFPISHASNAIAVTKIDTVDQIISGTFYFTLYGQYGPTSGDSVVVTDGRFDVTYNTCLCN